MADDLVLSNKVDRSKVIAAIEVLQKNSKPVNTASVAAELKIAISELTGNVELMKLITAARKESALPISDYDRLLARVKELEESNAKLKNAESSSGSSSGDDERRLLQARIDEEVARTRRLEEEARLLKNRNDALHTELNTIKTAARATVEIARPGDELGGLFTPSIPSAEEYAQLKQELDALKERCRSLESERQNGNDLSGDAQEIEHLRRELAELQEFKQTALSAEEQQALSEHLAAMTTRQNELSALVEHLQRENERLAEQSESVLSEEELAAIRQHLENLTAQNQELSNQNQEIFQYNQELANQNQELIESNEQLVARNQELSQQLESGGWNSPEQQELSVKHADLAEKFTALEKEKTKLLEQVAALENANQLLAATIQDAWHQGYQSAKLDFARENFTQVCDVSAAAVVADLPPGVSEQELSDLMSPGLFEDQQDTELAAHMEPLSAGLEQPSPQYEPTGHSDTASDGVSSLNVSNGFAVEYQFVGDISQPALQAAPQPEPQQGNQDPGYDPFAPVDAAAYGFAEPEQPEPAQEEADGSQPKSYCADELRDLLNTRLQHQDEDAKEEPAAPKTPLKKFVGSSRNTQEAALPSMPRNVPPDIRKACLLLGLKPEELTRQAVFNAWKREMAKPGVHPDTGGDTEMATYLNTAKDRLVRYLEETAPKLGKKFGTKEHSAAKEQTRPKK